MKVCAVISSLLKATFNESFVLKSYKMNFSVTDNIDEIDSNCLIANNNLQFLKLWKTVNASDKSFLKSRIVFIFLTFPIKQTWPKCGHSTFSVLWKATHIFYEDKFGQKRIHTSSQKASKELIFFCFAEIII